METKYRKKNASGFKKRFLKFLFWMFLVLASLIVILSLVFRYAYPPSKLKILIAKKVTQTTGRNFRIADLSFNPFGRLDIRGVELGFDPAQKMGDQVFLKLGKLSLKFRLLPLLKRKIEIKEILIEAPELYLIPSVSLKKEEVQTTDRTAENTSQTLKPLPVSLGLFSLQLNDFRFRVRFSDPNQDEELIFSGLNLNVSDLNIPRFYNRSSKDLSGTIHLFTRNGRLEYHTGKESYPFCPDVDLNLKIISDTSWALNSEIAIGNSHLPAGNEIRLSIQSAGTGYADTVRVGRIALSVDKKDVLCIGGKLFRSGENIEYRIGVNGDILDIKDFEQSLMNLLPDFLRDKIPQNELAGKLRLLAGTVRGNQEQASFQIQSKLDDLTVELPSQKIDVEEGYIQIDISGTASRDGFEEGEASAILKMGNLKYGLDDTTSFESGESTIELYSTLGKNGIPLQGRMKSDFMNLLRGRLAALIEWDNDNRFPVQPNQFNITGTVKADSLSLSGLPSKDLKAEGYVNLGLDFRTDHPRKLSANLTCETPGIQYMLDGENESTPPVRIESGFYASADPEFQYVSLDSGSITIPDIFKAVLTGKYQPAFKTFSGQLTSAQLDNQNLPLYLPGSVKDQIPGLVLYGNEELKVNIQAKLTGESMDLGIDGRLLLNQLGMSAPDQGVEVHQVNGGFTFQGDLNQLEGRTDIRIGEIGLQQMNRDPYRDARLGFSWYLSPGDSLKIFDGKLEALSLGLASSFMLGVGNMAGIPNLCAETDLLFHSEESVFPVQDFELSGLLGFHLSARTIQSGQSRIQFRGQMEADRFAVAMGKDLAVRNVSGSIPIELKYDLENQKIVNDSLFHPLTWVEYEDQQQLQLYYSDFIKQMRVDTIRFAGYQMEKIVIDLGITDGYIQVPSFQVNLLDGNLGGSILLDLGSLEKEHIRYAIQAQASRINSSALVGTQTAKEEETELNMTMSFKGEGIDLERSINLEGYFYITKMGPKFASTLLESMDPGGSDRSVRMTRRLLNMGWKPKLFSFDLRHGYVYPSLMLTQPWFSPIRIPGKLEYGRLPLAFFLKNLQTPAE